MLQIQDFVKLQQIIVMAYTTDCPSDPVLSLVLWIASSILNDIVSPNMCCEWRKMKMQALCCRLSPTHCASQTMFGSMTERYQHDLKADGTDTKYSAIIIVLPIVITLSIQPINSTADSLSPIEPTLSVQQYQ